MEVNRKETEPELVKLTDPSGNKSQGPGDEQRSGSRRGGAGLKIAAAIIILIVIVAAVALLTLSVTVMNATPGISMPFSTRYGVSFPEGQTITIGNVHISTLANQGVIISDIDGDKQNMAVGDQRVISERRAVITTLGSFTLIDTHFQITLTYKGERDNRAYYDMNVQTSAEVPQILLNHLLPPEIQAVPS